MRAAEYLGLSLFSGGLKFFVKCPYCGSLNRSDYWIVFNICGKCGRISRLRSEDVREMMEAERRFRELKSRLDLEDIEANLEGLFLGFKVWR